MVKTLGLSMIVKNEENQLKDCLRDIYQIFDEIVILDTGSKDQTLKITKQFTNKVHKCEWTDDFSEARNIAISKMHSDWIMVLDADERIMWPDLQKIKSFIRNKSYDAYEFCYKTYSNDSGYRDWQPNSVNDIYAYNSKGWYPMYKIRLFRNDPRIRFHGVVHECIRPALEKYQLKYKRTAINILHYGNITTKFDDKNHFYINLAQNRIKKEPSNPRNYYQLAVHYSCLWDFQKSKKYLEEALKIDPDFYLASLELSNVYIYFNQFYKAEQHLKKMENSKIADPGIYFNLGELNRLQKKNEAAINYYQKALKIDPAHIKTLIGYAEFCLKQGLWKKSIVLYKTTLSFCSNYFEALFNIGYCLTQINKYRKAIYYFKKAEKIDAQNVDLLMNIATTYYALRKEQQALEYYKKTYQLQPDNKIAKRNIVFLKEKLKSNY